MTSLPREKVMALRFRDLEVTKCKPKPNLIGSERPAMFMAPFPFLFLVGEGFYYGEQRSKVSCQTLWVVEVGDVFFYKRVGKPSNK